MREKWQALQRRGSVLDVVAWVVMGPLVLKSNCTVMKWHGESRKFGGTPQESLIPPLRHFSDAVPLMRTTELNFGEDIYQLQ